MHRHAPPPRARWPRTNAGFLARAAGDPDFVAGAIDTGFIERHADRLIPGAEPSDTVIALAAAAIAANTETGPWGGLTGFRANADADRRVAVEIAGQTHVGMLARSIDRAPILDDGDERVLFVDGMAWPFAVPAAGHGGAGGGASDGALLAPMPGRIIAVDVIEGAAVTKGQKLLVLEAMKMEQAMLAPFDGIVAELKAVAGGQVAEGSLLVRIAKAEG
jgi:3-methylcrotonyl-CoA carboxylase alpha subunit